MSEAKKIDDGGQAFPLSAHPEHGYGPSASVHSGMTLREYYAGQAMIGLLASGIAVERGQTHRDVADIAVMNADALIAALKVTP